MPLDSKRYPSFDTIQTFFTCVEAAAAAQYLTRYRVFLATDAEAVRTLAHIVFGDRVVYQELRPERDANHGSDLVDALLLAAADAVVITASSTFGSLGAAWAGHRAFVVRNWDVCYQELTPNPIFHKLHTLLEAPCFSRDMLHEPTLVGHYTWERDTYMSDPLLQPDTSLAQYYERALLDHPLWSVDGAGWTVPVPPTASLGHSANLNHTIDHLRHFVKKHRNIH